MAKPVFDTTQPMISAKNRIDDIMGYKTLQTDPVAILQSLETDISVCVRVLARSYLGQRIEGISSRPLKDVSEKEILSIVAEKPQDSNERRYVFPLHLRSTTPSSSNLPLDFQASLGNLYPGDLLATRVLVIDFLRHTTY